MTAENKIWHVSRQMADFDANGLYVSSTNRLAYLKGVPKVLQQNQLNKKFLDSVDGYFITIKIMNITKHRQFPLLTKVNEQRGVRYFTNDMIGQAIFIDKYGLEDAIEFQAIDYDITDGCYFNEGRNDKVQQRVNVLYETRAEQKKKGNKIEQVYKLLMNSAYGRTVLKPVITDTICRHKNQLDNYLKMSYNFIQEITTVDTRCYIKRMKAISNHFNYCQVGVEVLSMSNRIMNEVMCLGEDIGCKKIYQDTDSTHMDYEDVETLAIAYKDKYDKELVGDYMNQFHVDFDMFDENGNKIKGLQDICSIEAYFLGKKIYCHTLQAFKNTTTKKQN